MSEELKPEVTNPSDVVVKAEQQEAVKVEPASKPEKDTEAGLAEEISHEEFENEEITSEEKEEESLNLAEKTLAELTGLFQKLMSDLDRMKKSKEAEAIKAAFYKKLSKEKADAGLNASVNEPTESSEEEETVNEPVSEERMNPFEAIEAGFKSLYNSFKREKAEFNRRLEEEREDNLKKKQAVIEDLKELVEKQEDVNATFPEFRSIQNRWREIGPVPAQSFRNLNDTYQFYVEQFYDKVQINRDMRDLDFKKNLEAKEAFISTAEKLSENENIVEAFNELQKLHEQWKEFGPVAKEYRDLIWDRFKAATSVINKKYQAYFEGLKAQYAQNLEAKTKLCEKVEAIADKADITTSNEWNSLSREIEEIQKEWKTIGFASKKENQNIYDRFRAACDKFFERKRNFYSEFKDSMNENMEKKLAIIEQAESLKSSTEWKKTTDILISLQKQWKEIGAVPRKKSEQLWTRFRAACDEFFAERDKNNKPENDFYGNLKAKRALIEEIKHFESDDETLKRDAAASFNEKWNSIGFVPFKEKDNINSAFKEAMQEKFGSLYHRGSSGKGGRNSQQRQKAPLSERDRLVQKYNKLQQDLDTYENNIGFFAASKNAAPLIKQMEDKIEAVRNELKELETKIREIDSKE